MSNDPSEIIVNATQGRFLIIFYVVLLTVVLIFYGKCGTFFFRIV